MDSAEQQQMQLQGKQQQQKARCPVEGCNKKLTLVDFKCKCQNTYCAKHRVPDTHACSYDFRQEQTNLLMKHMSTAIVGNKIQVI
jgi:predicted nucleic acid binding AN1-type Zn finger protein